MNLLKILLFDLDFTFWYHDGKAKFIKICKELNIPFTNEYLNEYLKILKTIETKFETKLITETLIEQVFESATFLSHFKKSGKELLAAFKKYENPKLNQNAFNLVKTTYEKGFKNIALSNWFKEEQIKNLKRFNLLKYFDKIYGFDNFYLKQTPKGVQRIIKGSPENYIIIGDSLECDIKFATMAGIKSVWYNPNNKKNTTDFIPTYEINDLIQVLDILGL